MADNPIIVTDNTLEGQIGTLLRYLVTSLGGFALGKGWIDGEALQFFTGLMTVALPTAYGIWKTYTGKQKLIATAQSAPDYVAQVVHK
ncbi:MAG: hypothetical protein ACK4ZW_06005 [Blastomonas sp.]